MRILRPGLLGGLAAVALSASARLDDDTPAAQLALIGGTVYPSPQAEAIEDATVLIEDGRIAAVGPAQSVPVPDGAVVIDCSGRFVTAGFWNSHVHFFGLDWANAATRPAEELARGMEELATRHGFTSVFDTGSQWENTNALRARVDSGEVPGPRILTTGEPLAAPTAMPTPEELAAMGFAAFEAPVIRSDADAERATKELVSKGADGVKLHLQPPRAVDAPSFPRTAIAAAVASAAASRKPVLLHPDTGDDVRAAVAGGVDVVLHTTPGSGAWEEALFSDLDVSRTALTPTLLLSRAFGLAEHEALTQTAVQQLRAWIDHGGIVLFGNDAGAVDVLPEDEYRLMAEAGMDFRAVLASLTTLPAMRFGGAHVGGRIAPGEAADLVVLDADPGEDVGAFARVRRTIRGGDVLYERED